MRQDDLIQLLIGGIAVVFGIAVAGWKLLDARSASRIVAERQRADEALAREKTANDRAERYEAQRDKAMDAAREGAGLLAVLGSHVQESDRRCRDGLAALERKIDALQTLIASERKVSL